MPRKLELENQTDTREYKSNPEIDARIDRFMEANPGLVKAIQEMPRERLERKFFLMRAEQQENRLSYQEKVFAWIEENPDVKEQMQKQFGHVQNEKERNRMTLTAATGEMRSRGVRL